MTQLRFDKDYELFEETNLNRLYRLRSQYYQELIRELEYLDMIKKQKITSFKIMIKDIDNDIQKAKRLESLKA